LLNVLAYNMAQILKLFYLGAEARTWTLKTLRHRFMYVWGKMITTGRKYYCKILNVVDRVYELFENFPGAHSCGITVLKATKNQR